MLRSPTMIRTGTTLLLLLVLLGSWLACSPERSQRGQEDGHRSHEQTAGASRQESTASTAREKERDQAGTVILGEATAVDGLSIRVFDFRSENVPKYDSMDPPKDWPKSVSAFVPRPGYGVVYPVVAGDGYEAVAVDFVLENASSSPVAVSVQCTLVDAQGVLHYENGNTDTWPTGGDDIIEPSESDIELGPGEKEASTAFFTPQPGTDLKRPKIILDSDYSSQGEERRVTVDLTSDGRDEIPPEDYLYVYNDHFNQRAFTEAYRMLDPSSMRGVTLDDWLAFHESLWGKRHVSLDGLDRVAASGSRAAFEMDRTFYGADGRPLPDKETNANATQEMVRRGDKWKLVLTRDALWNQGASTASATPRSATPER